MLEQKIEALTAAVNQLIAVMSAGQSTQSAPAAPQFVAPTPAAPAMPAPPTFISPAPAAPAPAAPAVQVPFNDGASLINYVMAVYKEVGPAKGAQIQGVLTSLGYQNINDVKPESYAALHQGIEALRRG